MATPAILNINSSAVAFGDTVVTANPRRRFFDWSRSNNGIAVQNPKSEQYVVPGNSTLALFSGLRSTTLDGTTAFDLAQVTTSTYRFSWTGGTDPSLATARAMVFTNPSTLTLVVNANQSVTLTANLGTPFSALLTNDSVYVCGPADGAGTYWFNPTNSGLWKVLSTGGGGASVTLARPQGTSFSATAETVNVNNTDGAGQMLAFLPNVVQVDDKVDIESGFAFTGTFYVVNVTSKFFDVVSTVPFPAQTGILPTASGMRFFSSAKKFMRVEVDRPAKVFLNGSTDQFQFVTPLSEGDADQMGWLETTGPVWSLSVANRAAEPMTVCLFTVE